VPQGGSGLTIFVTIQLPTTHGWTHIALARGDAGALTLPAGCRHLEIRSIPPRHCRSGATRGRMARKNGALAAWPSSLLSVALGRARPPWPLGCQRFSSEQSTGGSTPVVYLFVGERSKTKDSMVMQWHIEQERHDKFILVRASRE
jgi:hypothetical protein